MEKNKGTHITTWLAVLFAAISSFYSAKSVYQANDQQRKSVRALVDQGYIRTNHDNGTSNIEFNMTNNGFGPAIISSFTVQWRDSASKPFETVDSWHKLSDILEIPRDKPGYTEWLVGDVLRHNQKYINYSVLLSSSKVDSILSDGKLKIILEYSTLYDESYTSELSIKN